jgi:ribose/xylose/arabinose/galactoside ABC-type transport system permease subunit
MPLLQAANVSKRFFGAAVLKGTGESRAVPEDPMAFGGCAWLIALVVATGAVGGNREAARLSGVRVGRILVSVYTIMGFLAGLAGFMETARLDSAEAVVGDGFELRVIASVVIGGTSLFGGLGGVLGIVVGTVLIGVLLNGLVIMNVSPYYQQIIIGVIIVLTVAFDTFAKSRSGTVSTG